jgi:CubicO group peptidase (beta-lactamase class C family)
MSNHRDQAGIRPARDPLGDPLGMLLSVSCRGATTQVLNQPAPETYRRPMSDKKRSTPPASPETVRPTQTAAAKSKRSKQGSSLGLTVTAEPEALGLDLSRLERIATRLDRYVAERRFPGYSVAVGRAGEVGYVHHAGMRDVEAGLPVEDDTVFRIYSMTKPITAVAALVLWEQGAFELTDPVSKYIPSFADCRVYVKGTAVNNLTVPVTEPVRIWHLLTHTAGLSYGFMKTHPVDELYRMRGYDLGTSNNKDLASACDDWAAIPLLFQPGSQWSYSVGLDVMGRIIEVVSGKSLDRFFDDEIFTPLQMTETGFGCRPDQIDRLAALYVPIGENQSVVRYDLLGKEATVHNPAMLAGGGGLVSTLRDYYRFQQMLLGGGALDGTRILGPNSVRFMASNHLPGNADLEQYGQPLFSETPFPGVGFGLGVSVTIDPVASKNAGSIGDFGWGGAASTWMLVDPAQDITLTFMTQLLPSSTYPVRTQLKQALHQAIVGPSPRSSAH